MEKKLIRKRLGEKGVQSKGVVEKRQFVGEIQELLNLSKFLKMVQTIMPSDYFAFHLLIFELNLQNSFKKAEMYRMCDFTCE